jgi:hypothetical protein
MWVKPEPWLLARFFGSLTATSVWSAAADPRLGSHVAGVQRRLGLLLGMPTAPLESRRICVKAHLSPLGVASRAAASGRPTCSVVRCRAVQEDGGDLVRLVDPTDRTVVRPCRLSWKPQMVNRLSWRLRLDGSPRPRRADPRHDPLCGLLPCNKMTSNRTRGCSLKIGFESAALGARSVAEFPWRLRVCGLACSPRESIPGPRLAFVMLKVPHEAGAG